MNKSAVLQIAEVLKEATHEISDAMEKLQRRIRAYESALKWYAIQDRDAVDQIRASIDNYLSEEKQ